MISQFVPHSYWIAIQILIVGYGSFVCEMPFVHSITREREGVSLEKQTHWLFPSGLMFLMACVGSHCGEFEMRA
jgi:hypothetical protein